MRRSIVLLLLLVLLLPAAGSTARAQEPLPSKCVCSDGQRLSYDPNIDYVLQVHGWTMLSDREGCYYECLEQCGCDRYDLDLTCSYNCIIGPHPTQPAVTVPPAPAMPCPEPAFFYPGINLTGYFTDESPLRFSRSDLVSDLGQALEKYIEEGNPISAGVGVNDVHSVAKSLVSSAMPTGKEASLQEAARNLARIKQMQDPNYRLTPGDLFYLSLKENGGNVRDALLTCHAALYRDGKEMNKKFVEQEGILTPLRNPAGYVDGSWSYTTPQGSSRTVNPLQELGGEEQGVWYHLFGMAALEYTDLYGAASYYAAWIAIYGGGLPENYTDRVIKHGVPNSGLGGRLGDLAIALEDNVRQNMGKPPDIVKHCLNFDGIAVGTELKRITQLEYQRRETGFKTPYDPRNKGNILDPRGVIIYKSPLSLRIEGSNGEWFTFDQESGFIDGNTALLYFEAFLEEDGGWGILAAPFFPVQSMQLIASGDGPVTLGIYNAADQSSSVYEFAVQKGDRIQADSLARPPQHNGDALVPAFQQGNAGPGLNPSVLWTGGIVLLVVLLAGLVAWRSSRRRSSAGKSRATRPSAAAGQSGKPCPRCGTVQTGKFCSRCGAPLDQEPAAAQLCPTCGQPVRPKARFCKSCGAKIS